MRCSHVPGLLIHLYLDNAFIAVHVQLAAWRDWFWFVCNLLRHFISALTFPARNHQSAAMACEHHYVEFASEFEPAFMGEHFTLHEIFSLYVAGQCYEIAVEASGLVRRDTGTMPEFLVWRLRALAVQCFELDRQITDRRDLPVRPMRELKVFRERLANLTEAAAPYVREV